MPSLPRYFRPKCAKRCRRLVKSPKLSQAIFGIAGFFTIKIARPVAATCYAVPRKPHPISCWWFSFKLQPYNRWFKISEFIPQHSSNFPVSPYKFVPCCLNSNYTNVQFVSAIIYTFTTFRAAKQNPGLILS